MKEPETLHQGRFLALVRREGWEYAHRHGLSGVTTIVAETVDGRVLFVEQHRPPLGRTVLELPAGLAGDEPGAGSESLLEAARRELEEETGFGGGAWRTLGVHPTSAGLTSEEVAFFHATGVDRLGGGGGVGDERITLHEVPRAELGAWLERQREAGRPVAVHALAGLWLAGLYPVQARA
jgi:ADP-ribose pyrophosphatase